MFLKNNKLYYQWRSLEWISMLGDSFYYIALLSYASNLSNPKIAIMIISISEIFPRVFEVFLGVLADSTRQRTKRFFQSGIFRGFCYLLIGIIMLKSNSIIGILIIGILNALSDLFGSYVELCISPFIKLIVDEDDLEESLAINSFFHNFIYMFANLIGAALLGVLGIQLLAFFNALTFFFVAFGVKAISSQLIEVEKKIEVGKFTHIKDVVNHILYSLKDLISEKSIRNFFLFAACLNSFSQTTIPVLSIYLSQNKDFQIINLAYSVAITQGLIVLSGLLGNFLGPKYFTRLSTNNILAISYAGNMLFSVFIFKNLPMLAVLSLLISTFTIGIFNIRFSVIILKNTPLEKMGIINSCMNTFFMVIPALISTVLISLVTNSIFIYALFVGVISITALLILFLTRNTKLDIG
ncbi:hypothetical protein BG261_06335 [Floricoccus tropicus]|uniref:Major facilitator superfamily (MFS) profile domain-containing protein n=1 Tax=Floricoccus tropicus TaxID=1859473 RepID=A0A1E8GJV3_9LACT|nr:MFS transporter [Floricoccus tropicus]OFI48512.1 hypothetical protein BG261_06335 [Floricoccus tropicus]